MIKIRLLLMLHLVCLQSIQFATKSFVRYGDEYLILLLLGFWILGLVLVQHFEFKWCKALRETWPHSLETVNLVRPSQSMQHAGQGLVQDLKTMPLVHSYSSIQALSQKLSKSERKHDLVILSYVLGEIPSLQDRITIVRQLWVLSNDILRSGRVPLHGYEDEKFSYVAFRCGERPQEDWPLDGIKLETFKELRANRNPEDLLIVYEEETESEDDAIVPHDEQDPASYNSDAEELDSLTEYTEEEDEVEETGKADLGKNHLHATTERKAD